MGKRKHLILIGAVVLIVMAGALSLIYYWMCPEFGSRTNAYVGMTRAQAIAKWGMPTRLWPGHYGLMPKTYTDKHPKVRTMVYQNSCGELYMSFDPVGNKWICFSSSWLPRGGAY